VLWNFLLSSFTIQGLLILLISCKLLLAVVNRFKLARSSE
jgi:hypothetical protein